MLSAPMQVHVTVAGACVIIQMEVDSFMANSVSVMIENAWMMKRKKYVEAMGSVTVETVTARLVGMEINVNSSVTSPPGKASEDAHLQTAESAATEERVYVVNVLAMMLIQLETGETFTGTRVNVMKETAELFMIDTLMISVQVMDSVTVGDVTAEQAGMERSVSTPGPAHCRLRRVSGSARVAPVCLVLEGANVNVADAPVILPGTPECTARPASVMTGIVRTWAVWSVEAMACVPVAVAFVRKDGLASFANTCESVI